MGMSGKRFSRNLCQNGKNLWFILGIFTLPYISEAAKILVVFPFPSKSHNILGESLNRILLKDGHEITYITSFPKENPLPNLHYVNVSYNMELLQSHFANLKNVIEKKESGPDFKQIFTILMRLSKEPYASEDVQKLINDQNQTFDLIIIEWMFSELSTGLAALYDCPYIWFFSAEPDWQVLGLIDEALNPAYNPSILSTNNPPFNFVQRVQELFIQLFFFLLRTIFLLPSDRAEYNKIFGPIVAKKGRSLPTMDEVMYNASLMLGNSHVSIGKPIRLPQNYIPIGGYHIDPDVKPLPEGLKKIMDTAKVGVIYFSLGSNAESKSFPDEIKSSLLNMFGNLKYTVIWKFEEQMSNIPKKVHVLQWAPQASILAHPKCKLFITHGGQLSTLEAVYYGVPAIGIPVIADQSKNVDLSVNKGFALRVDLSYHMADDLKVAIQEMLGNPKYKEKAAELKILFHDRPVSPSTELSHWVKHVIRTKGAPHLRSPALMVPWHQKMYLDLLALVLLAIYVFVKAIKLLLLFLSLLVYFRQYKIVLFNRITLNKPKSN